MKHPKIAVWLLDRFGINPALVGDLLEEAQCGRSRGWFWRQTVRAIGAAAGRNARLYPRDIQAVLAGWMLQVCAAWAVFHFHLVPQWHGVLWRSVACLVLLFCCALYGAAKGSIRALAGIRRAAEIACDSFVVNFLVFLIFVLLAWPPALGLATAEICWLFHDLAHVLFRHPTAC